MSHDRVGLKKSTVFWPPQERGRSTTRCWSWRRSRSDTLLGPTLMRYIDEIAIVARRYAAIWVEGGLPLADCLCMDELTPIRDLSSSLALNHD